MSRRLAFSLIELIIVVAIIGLLAAIAVPRMSRASEGAVEAALRADLTVLRKAIDHYAAEHRGVLPAANGDGFKPAGDPATFWRQLRKYSNEDGVTSDTHGLGFVYGPYLKTRPVAPLGPASGDQRVSVETAGAPLSGMAVPTRAWKYDTVTGQIIFNYTGVASDGTTYDSW